MLTAVVSSLFLSSTHLPLTLVAWSALLWILWYLWAFTIHPALNPDEPVKYPHWIPFIGHARRFVHDAGSLVADTKKHVGPQDILCLEIAGNNLYIITSAETTKEFYKNTDALNFTAFQLDTLKQFGMSDRGCKLMRDHATAKTNGKSNLNIDLIIDIYHQNLNSTLKFSHMTAPVIEYISTATQWDNLPSRCFSYPNYSTEESVVSLYTLCEDVILRANINAFWGRDLLKIAPDLVCMTSILDKKFHSLLLRVPRFLVADVYRLRDKVLADFVKYMEIPEDSRTQMSPLVGELEKTSNALGLSRRDTAVYHLAWLLASNNNIHAACFWVLAHLSQLPNLADEIRKETESLSDDQLSSASALKDNCPNLTSLWQEVLRLYGGPHTSGRHVQQDTLFAGKKIRRGASLLVATAQLHRDQSVWGADADEFVPDRFLRNPQLANRANYRPFGGGVSYCSGRNLAFIEMTMLVSCLLHRYDLVHVPSSQGAGFPRPLKAAPLLGTMHVADGEDQLVKLVRR